MHIQDREGEPVNKITLTKSKKGYHIETDTGVETYDSALDFEEAVRSKLSALIWEGER